MSQDITIKELISQFQREISSAVHDLGAVSAFSKKLPQCQVDQLNREFLRLSSLLEEVDKKIKRASSKISQGNEQWGDGSFSTITSPSTDHQQAFWNGVKNGVKKEFVKTVNTLQAISTASTLISLTPPPIPAVPERQTDASSVQYQEPNFCSLDDKVNTKKSSADQWYESLPEMARVMETNDQLEESYTQQKESEAERKKKELDIVEDQEIAAGSPPPD